VAYTPRTMMNERIMAAWIRYVYHPMSKGSGIAKKMNADGSVLKDTDGTVVKDDSDDRSSVLFLDNHGSHRTCRIAEIFSELKIKVQYLPPNCTPLLQPLDFCLNALFKRIYEEQWSRWYREVGRYRKNKNGGQGKATEDEVNSWCATAAASLTKETIIKCFNHTLNGEKVVKEAELKMRLRKAAGINVVLPEVPISDADNKGAKDPLGRLEESGELIFVDKTVSVVTPSAISTIILTSANNRPSRKRKRISDKTDEE
jgi:hypothetical protein